MTEKRIFDIKRFSGSKTAMLLNGIVCAVPFVFEHAFLLSWFCFVPYVLSFMKEKSELRTNQFIRNSFFFGYGFYFVGYSWLCELYPLEYLGIEPTIALPLIVFVVAIVPAIHAVLLAFCAAFCRKLSEKAPFWLRLGVFPCVFVLAEYLQSLGTFAFPWCRLFVTQAAVPSVLQSASLFGSYFLTYFILFVNSLLAAAVMLPQFCRRAVTLALALFGIHFSFGAVRLSKMERAYIQNNAYFGAAVLQGNYPYKYKENDSVQSMAARYFALCDSALDELERNADVRARTNALVVLPETAIPVTFFDVDRGYPKLFAAYAEKERISIAVGAFSSEKRPDAADRDVYGNSVFVFMPDGTMSAPYSKQHLVPFGEYLPYRRFFERFFPALADSAAFGTDLTAGNGTVLPETPVGKVGVQICYESVFGKFCRAQVNGGAEILLISTNDSTFGSSQALRHHLAQAQMRAIENNVPVLRAANTGISALIASDGRLVKTLGADETGYLAGLLPYGTGSTLYRTIGDSILLLFAALLLASYLYPKLLRKR